MPDDNSEGQASEHKDTSGAESAKDSISERNADADPQVMNEANDEE